jgi:hypothetical protein
MGEEALDLMQQGSNCPVVHSVRETKESEMTKQAVSLMDALAEIVTIHQRQ